MAYIRRPIDPYLNPNYWGRSLQDGGALAAEPTRELQSEKVRAAHALRQRLHTSSLLPSLVVAPGETFRARDWPHQTIIRLGYEILLATKNVATPMEHFAGEALPEPLTSLSVDSISSTGDDCGYSYMGSAFFGVVTDHWVKRRRIKYLNGFAMCDLGDHATAASLAESAVALHSEFPIGQTLHTFTDKAMALERFTDVIVYG